MSVELRCPECRAKLRLPEAPDPGTEVECPKCSTVFSAPDPDTGDVPDRRAKSLREDDEDRPRKKKPVDDEDEDRPKKKATAEKKPAADKGQPRKRKAKKKETNQGLLVIMVGGGVIFLGMVILLIVWYTNRKPAAYEMLTYLPEDCNKAAGFNIGHVQKYPEFLKKIESTYQGLGCIKAADATAQALGLDFNSFLDYVIEGMGPSSGAVVLRSKKDFDPSKLAKLPGAREGSSDGQKYYAIGDIGLSYSDARVFAPTNRIVVFCPGSIAEGTFKKMVRGNKDNMDKTLVGRLGQLGKRTTRGTYWALGVLDEVTRPDPPPETASGIPGQGTAFQSQLATTAGAGKGYGFKASVGSRSVRFEAIMWCRDADAANDLYTKLYKDTEFSKLDEADPPRWWRDFSSTQISNKKIQTALLANLGAKATGELFLFYSEVDTREFMEVVNQFTNKLIGPSRGGPGGGGPGGMPGPLTAPGAPGTSKK